MSVSLPACTMCACLHITSAVSGYYVQMDIDFMTVVELHAIDHECRDSRFAGIISVMIRNDRRHL